jgi:hypothetical protein
MKKAVRRIYRMMLEMLDVCGWVTYVWVTRISRCLGLSAAFREAYNTGVLCVWYVSIGIHSILFHVEFEDGLIISVLNNRGNSSQKFTFGNRKVCKKKKTPTIFQPPPFSNSYVAQGTGWFVPLHTRVSKITGAYAKKKSWRWAQVSFLLTAWDYA